MVPIEMKIVDAVNGITDWLTAIGTISAVIVALFIALFQEKIRAWLQRPVLDVSIQVSPPDCHKITLVAYTQQGSVAYSADCYYFRLRVRNAGNQRAELVEVFASELTKEKADGSFEKVDGFLPMNLLWSHIRKPFFDAISPGMEKHCSLGHIVDPSKRTQFGTEDYPQLGVSPTETLFSFDLEVTPTTMSHLIPPGKYRLTILVGAANTKPIKKILEINHTGKWFGDEKKMLGDGIGICIL